MEILTEIVIERAPENVWRELADFAKYPEWNPFIKSISGELLENKKLKVHICPPGDKRGMWFSPRVKRVVVEREFAWKGKLLLPGLFDGEHFFHLEPIGENQTRFIHGEKFSGLLVPFLKEVLVKTKSGFEIMNTALKTRVESINQGEHR